MCTSCQALREEFAEDIIRRRLAITEGEAGIVAAMYRDGLYNPTDIKALKCASVLVHRLREVLGPQAIETVRHRGYQLSEAGRQKVAQALELAA